MAGIEKNIVEDKAVTVFKINGKVTVAQLIDEITRFYQSNFTKHTLWDFSDAEMKGISSKEVQNVVSHTKGFGHLRRNCKTALVVSSSLGYGMGRMYGSFAQVDNHPVKHGVFRTCEDAFSWIEEAD